MRPLPRILVTWQESSVPEERFLGYRVWRRRAGETEWQLRAEIPTRARTQFEDFLAQSRLRYQYTVTQRALIGLDEVESEAAPVVEASVVIRSVFLHVHGDEARYVELRPTSQRLSEQRAVAHRRVWGRTDPVPVIAPGRTVEVSLSGSEPWGADDGRWDAIEALFAAQEAGAVIVGRQDRWAGTVTLLNRSRSDGAVLYEWEVTLAVTDGGEVRL